MFSSTTNNATAQTTTMKDCCMMKGGKMTHIKDGKEMHVGKDMTMKNGTKCMTNGECMMKEGKKMQMKDGQCMDMNGKMNNCSMMNKDMKSSIENKTDKKRMAMTYTGPMHPQIIKDNPGKCPICGMDLVKKK